MSNLKDFVMSYLQEIFYEDIFASVNQIIKLQLEHLLFVLENIECNSGIIETHNGVFESHLRLQDDIKIGKVKWEDEPYYREWQRTILNNTVEEIKFEEDDDFIKIPIKKEESEDVKSLQDEDFVPNEDDEDNVQNEDDDDKKFVKPKIKAKISSNYNYICNFCQFKSIRKRTLQKHMFINHDDTKCKYCEENFDKFEDLVKHEDSLHSKYNCSICGKALPNQKALVKHEYKHSYGEKMGGFCNICGFWKNHLEAHIKKVHEKVHLNDDSLKCKTCGLHCKSKHDLEKHIKYRHSVIGPEPCPYCGKFVKMLEKHLRRNQCNLSESERTVEEKRLKCDDCGKDFKNQQGLRAHIKKFHSVGKNIKCDFCEYRTYQNSNLYMHVKRMHEGRSLKVECVHCSKMCVNIEWHMKMYHNGIVETN